MEHTHSFYIKLARILNTGKSRSVILSGNIFDLFFDGKEWVPLLDFLVNKCAVKPSEQTRGVTLVVYEINRQVRLIGDDGDSLKNAWNKFKLVDKQNKANDFDELCKQTSENPTFAMEFMRQISIASRQEKLNRDLVFIVEGAEMLLPVGNYSSLQFPDRKRLMIVQDWFSDPKFTSGHDSVILLAESASLIHPIIARLPQVLSIEVPAPNLEDRKAYSLAVTGESIYADMTAGLTLQAYRQILCDRDNLNPDTIIEKVGEFICSQLGDDVVEFKRPKHKLADVRGFSLIKKFIKNELIPRFMAMGEEALPGAAVAGPIGGGKTYVMEAMVAELDMPVLVLKNLRSQWFGQTDVILERLIRVLDALGKVCIFVDEADTMFGGLGQDTHETERRLTGKIQAMMSDPARRGKIIWLLMTARIHMLSADIRRPGRVGDLIIPMLDPEDDDRKEFLSWLASATTDYKELNVEAQNNIEERFDKLTVGYSAASFAALRSLIKAKKCNSTDAQTEAEDLIPADIGKDRRFQVLQALLNCTRKSLIPESYYKGKTLADARQEWKSEVDRLSLEMR